MPDTDAPTNAHPDSTCARNASVRTCVNACACVCVCVCVCVRVRVSVSVLPADKLQP